MDSDFDLESLVHLEQTFYDQGFTDGFAHGKIHGLIEGRALGREKGFEMWEELGFYEGFAKCWKEIIESGLKGKGKDELVVAHSRAMQHIHHLLELIRQFPCVNPSTPANDEADIDISKLQSQIRSRYKVLCSCLGVPPRLRVASEADVEMDDTRTVQGSLIPVWKLDRSSGIRSKVTNMDLNY